MVVCGRRVIQMVMIEGAEDRKLFCNLEQNHRGPCQPNEGSQLSWEKRR